VPIRFFNTLSRQKDEFRPLVDGEARIYNCGPTIYNFAHIGNLRTFLFEDLLRRHLKYRGYKVTQVMNLTDVEDKIIRSCKETGESLKVLTERYRDAFFEDLATLGVERAEHFPAATDHIDEMVALIKRLEAKGHAYRTPAGVYFKLTSYPNYGKLSRFDMENLKDGGSGRVDSDEYDLEDARDFALWKTWDDDDGDVFWETELGKGRPGWHIECSCMSMKYLGETFDIHCGGVDLVFPHHENEIAQSEAATGKPLAHYWLHAEHLRVDGRKMSKSLGNIYTLRDLMKLGHDPMAIRWVLLTTHYRQPSNFTFEAVEAAKQSLERLRAFRLRLDSLRGEGSDLKAECSACEEAFGAALDDDLNISAAVAAVFDFIRETNRLIDANSVGALGARNAVALLERLDAVTGLFGFRSDEVPADIHRLALERQQARRSKNFTRADEIRDQLDREGWVVEDTADGPRIKRKLERHD
jgi:cysteinyl-tRNA synthetase